MWWLVLLLIQEIFLLLIKPALQLLSLTWSCPPITDFFPRLYLSTITPQPLPLFSSLRTLKALAYHSMVTIWSFLPSSKPCILSCLPIILQPDHALKMSRELLKWRMSSTLSPFLPWPLKPVVIRPRTLILNAVVNADIQPQSKHTFQCGKRLLCGPSALCLSHLILTISQ